jgi:hypothetical protein
MKVSASAARKSNARRAKDPKKHVNARPELMKGQVWKAADAYILITEVGKLLIHYRVGNRPHIHTSPARISSKQDVQAYLERHDGVLLHDMK